MDKMEIIVYILLGLIVLTLVAALTDCLWYNVETKEGIIIERSYTPEQTGTGVGVAVGERVGPAVTVTHNSEKWTVLVKIDDKVIPIEVSPEMWMNLKPQTKVKIEKHTGKVFGIEHLAIKNEKN